MDERPRRISESAFRLIGDEGGLVVLPRLSEVKVLNPVGSRVFALLDGEHTIDQIVGAIAEEFEIGADQARQDVVGFLAELQTHGMLASETASGDAP